MPLHSGTQSVGQMTEIECLDCGHRWNAIIVGRCPECRGRGQPVALIEQEREKERAEQKRLEALRARGVTSQYKAVGLTILSGVADVSDFQKALDKMAADGWEFAFFCDGPHLVSAGAPILIFKRPLPTPK